MEPLVVDLRNAYEGRSNDSFYPALDRLQKLLARHSPLKHLDPYGLSLRREQVAAELADVDAEIQRRQQPTVVPHHSV